MALQKWGRVKGKLRSAKGGMRKPSWDEMQTILVGVGEKNTNGIRTTFIQSWRRTCSNPQNPTLQSDRASGANPSPIQSPVGRAARQTRWWAHSLRRRRLRSPTLGRRCLDSILPAGRLVSASATALLQNNQMRKQQEPRVKMDGALPEL